MFWDKKDTPVNTDAKAIEELLTRGVTEIIDRDKLKSSLLEGKKLRIKLGIDPTSPNIHIGRAVVLRKLRAFQDLGHTIVFIIGDFTGVIGDTSDKESERPMLTSETISENMKEYFAQVGKILDMSKVEKQHNSKWLSGLTFKEIGEQADQFSVAEFIARENIDRRLTAGSRISLREMLYPLMQGYDSVEIKADVEIGGTDQRFNMLAGRTLQAHYKQKPQAILMTKLLSGLDGRKMSSSWGNTINLNDSPVDMYGKAMSIKDDLITEFFFLATDVPNFEVASIDENIRNGSLHPKDAKMSLARELVKIYHSPKEAERAEEQFVNTFSKKEIPQDVLEVEIMEEELLSDTFIKNEIVQSKSEFNRLIEQGAIEELPGATITDSKAIAKRNTTYKVGKRRFLKTK